MLNKTNGLTNDSVIIITTFYFNHWVISRYRLIPFISVQNVYCSIISTNYNNQPSAYFDFISTIEIFSNIELKLFMHIVSIL